jgi:hypothetical protein
MINRALNPAPDLILTNGAKMPSNRIGGKKHLPALRSAVKNADLQQVMRPGLSQAAIQ